MRQDDNKRNQQDQLAQQRNKNRHLRLSKSDKHLLQGQLYAENSHPQKKDRHDLRGQLHNGRVVGKDAHRKLWKKHRDTPQQQTERQAEYRAVLCSRLHTVIIARAVIKADDWLRALCKPHNRHRKKLHYAGHDDDGAHIQIAAIRLHRRIKGDLHKALRALHDKRRQPQCKHTCHHTRADAQILNAQAQRAPRGTDKPQHPGCGNRL